MLGSGHLQHRDVGLFVPFPRAVLLWGGFPLANLSQGIYTTGQEELASVCARGGSGWILGKFLHGKGG